MPWVQTIKVVDIETFGNDVAVAIQPERKKKLMKKQKCCGI